MDQEFISWSDRMIADMTIATAVPLPAHSGIIHLYPSVQLADAYTLPLPAGASSDPEVLARFMFAHQPAWIGVLMRVRDTVVAWFGLKTSKQLTFLAEGERTERVGIFKVYSKTATEIVVGEDDTHLDFRVSVLLTAGPAPQMVVSTVVQCHNRLGRTYLLVIAPFHRMVVKASLRRAAEIGWPRA
jgi:hypothetical protein